MPDPLTGELLPVLFRDVWPDESASFTPWLARPENLNKFDQVFRPIIAGL